MRPLIDIVCVAKVLYGLVDFMIVNWSQDPHGDKVLAIIEIKKDALDRTRSFVQMARYMSAVRAYQNGMAAIDPLRGYLVLGPETVVYEVSHNLIPFMVGTIQTFTPRGDGGLIDHLEALAAREMA